MNKKKILSLIMALVMLVGVFSPLSALAAGEHKTDVVVHKIELKDLTGWPKKSTDEGLDEDKTKYDGSKLKLGYFGTDAKELDNVKFTYWKVTEADYKVLDADHGTYDNVKAVEDKLKELVADRNKSKEEGEAAETVPVAKTVTTTKNGAEIKGLTNGYYWFVEDKDSVSRDGRTFAGAAAVPFGLTLPYAKADGKPFGTGDDALHVYPKNKLADKPLIDKDFKGKANPQKPREDKNTPESHNVGDKIPYEIKTVFQPNSQYKTAFWTDQMTEGLTFDQGSLTVKVGEKTLTKGTDYTVDTTVNNFKVVLTDEGLKAVNNQKEQTTVTIEYTATLTNKAVVDVPESNDVVFHYGNNPSQGNTPKPNNPKDKKLTFTKTWSDDKGDIKEIKVQLYNANTGDKVGDPKTLNDKNNWSVTWENLDDSIEYKAIEIGTDGEYGVDGWDAEYTKGEAGVIGANNHKTNNPRPLNPDEPKVITHGIKFVKMEKNTDIRLKDAVFYVKNSEGKYLQPSNGADKTAFQKAQDAYSKAVEDYNKLTAEQQTEEAKKAVQDKADERDKAWNEYLSNMTVWGDKGTALELKSDEAGAFEIKGLAAGTYKLEEKTAPQGYAKIEQDIEFTLGKGSYTTGNINYNPIITGNDATRVDNTKITIPQTGGMGTVLFTVVGISLMAGAVIAMKKNREEA